MSWHRPFQQKCVLKPLLGRVFAVPFGLANESHCPNTPRKWARNSHFQVCSYRRVSPGRVKIIYIYIYIYIEREIYRDIDSKVLVPLHRHAPPGAGPTSLSFYV